MGRLVRRYIRAYKLTIRAGGILADGSAALIIQTSGTGNVKLGSITTKETGAAPGTYSASFKLTHSNTIALTSTRLCAMSINLEPTDALDAYAVTGAEICTYMASAVTVSGGRVIGLFVETQGAGTIASDFYSLYVYSAPGANPTGDSACIRVESNPATVTWVDSFIQFAGNPNFMFKSSAQGTSDLGTGDKTGTPSGWYKVDCGGATRYIQLYA